MNTTPRADYAEHKTERASPYRRSAPPARRAWPGTPYPPSPSWLD
jgi:hypothetical protein